MMVIFSFAVIGVRFLTTDVMKKDSQSTLLMGLHIFVFISAIYACPHYDFYDYEGGRRENVRQVAAHLKLFFE